MSEQNSADDLAVKNDPVTPPAEAAIPKARLDQVIGERNTLRSEMDTLKAELNTFKTSQDEAEKAKRLKAGEQNDMIAELETKLKAAQGNSDKLVQMQAQQLDSLRSQLPEDKQETYKGVTDLALLQSLVNDFKITGGGAPSDRSAVPKEDFGGYGSMTEWANKDIKSFGEHMAKENATSIPWGVVPED